MKKTLALFFMLGICLFFSACGPALVVDSSGDQPDSDINDGICKTANNDCTLRAAIMEANLSDDVSKITFKNISLISPTTSLPILTASNTHINGEGTVILNGSLIEEKYKSGILIRDSRNNIIQGLTIQNFWYGIKIYAYQGQARLNVIGLLDSVPGDGSERNIIIFNKVGIAISGINASENTISGNYIGMNGDGLTPGPNEFGVSISSDAHDNLIGSTSGTGISQGWNLISGNSEAGIYLSEGFQNHITGNYIGTNLSGTSSIGNFDGIRITNGSKNNIIGISPSGEGNLNLISGNLRDGIFIMDQDSYTNVIAGNLIGTNFDGSAALGNGWAGISNSGDANRIGTNGDGSYDQLEANVISGNGTVGIGLHSNSNQVSGNMIGVDKTGMVGIGNALDGISVHGSDNLIGTDGDGVADVDERNIISANAVNTSGSAGIAIYGNINIVAGNYIGTDATGSVALGNNQEGISLGNSASGNLIGTDGDGQSDNIEGNLISGNRRAGIFIQNASENTIAGNLIGTDSTGTAALPNGYDNNSGLAAVHLSSGAIQNIIGTNGDGQNNSAEGNIISGNSHIGIYLTGPNTYSNTLAGNHIGVDITASSVLGNLDGIFLGVGADYNLIGTNADGTSDINESNYIGGNTRYGISVSGSFNQISGNYIGTDQFGAADLGNGLPGISITDNTTENIIGGSSQKANIIAFNKNAGVVVAGMNADKVEILYNSIHSNERNGISLDGPVPTGPFITPNDPGDVDSGPNDLMNFPVLTSASSIPASLSISGQISDGLPGTNFLIQLFANDICDPYGYHGEGKTFLKSINMTTDSNGNGTFASAFSAVVPAGNFITATATTDYKTSEFSECIEVTEGQVTYSQELEKNPCDQFDPEEMTITTFDVRPESGQFILYVKNPSPYPGTAPDDDWEYTAVLGDIPAAKCNFQGFEDRLYCDFYIPETYFNTAQTLKLFSNLCVPPFYINEKVSIFALSQPVPGQQGPGCSSDMSESDCIAGGGTYSCVVTCSCTCP